MASRPRNFRRKPAAADILPSTDDTQPVDFVASSTPIPAPLPPPVTTKKPVLLSFEDEEDITKTLHTPKDAHKSAVLQKKMKRDTSVSIESTATVVFGSSSGEYTPEKLANLRKNATALKPQSRIATPVPPVRESTTSNITVHSLPSAAPALIVSPGDATLVGDEAISLMDVDEPEKEESMPATRSTASDFIPLDTKKSYEVETGTSSAGSSKSRIKFGDPGRDKINLKPYMPVPDSEDNEDQEWEDEQIRKGCVTDLNKAKMLIQKKSNSSMLTPMEPLSTLSPEALVAKLSSTLQQLKDFRDSQTASLSKVQSDMELCDSQLKDLQVQAGTATEQHKMFISLKEYLKNVLDLFGEKAPNIEQLEEQLMQAESDKAKARRAKSENKSEYLKAAQIADAQAVEDASDSEDETAASTFTAVKDAILAQSVALFDDTNEEYRSLYQIKHVLESWKTRFPDTYKQAYCSLSAPALFAPLVRHELLSWEPLSSVSFSTFSWYQALMDYGINEQSSDIDPNDPDLNMVPTLVEKVVLPRVHSVVSRCWDPYSTTQTARLRELVTELLVYLDANLPQFKLLLTEIIITLQGAVDRAPKVALPAQNTSSQAYNAHKHLVWRIAKLAVNVISWKDLLDTASLQKLSLQNLLNTKLLPAMRTLPTPHSLAVAEKLVGVLPPSWVLIPTTEQISPFIQLFNNFLDTVVAESSDSALKQQAKLLQERLLSCKPSA